MEIREVFSKKNTLKQNPEGGEGESHVGIRGESGHGRRKYSAKALMWGLTFLEYWVNDVKSIYFSSFCSHQL